MGRHEDMTGVLASVLVVLIGAAMLLYTIARAVGWSP